MSDKAEAAVAIFAKQIAKQIGKSDSIKEWIEVDQKRINAFNVRRSAESARRSCTA